MSSFDRSLVDNARQLLSSIPGVRDASSDAIHDARVVARRLRAALDVIERSQVAPRFEEAARLVRATGRALGRARDVDVSLALLADLERRATPGAKAITMARLELVRERAAARRRMVKRIDSLQLDRLPILVSGAIPRVDRVIAARARERARELAELIDRASGVYFPRRAHAARIGIKRLRYLLEFGGVGENGQLKSLRKSQQILGDIQDRKVLHDLVADQRRADRDGDGADDEREALLAMLEAESIELYAKFLELREDLLALCHRVAASPRRHTPAAAMVGVAALAAGTLWHTRHRRLAAGA